MDENNVYLLEYVLNNKKLQHEQILELVEKIIEIDILTVGEYKNVLRLEDDMLFLDHSIRIPEIDKLLNKYTLVNSNIYEDEKLKPFALKNGLKIDDNIEFLTYHGPILYSELTYMDIYKIMEGCDLRERKLVLFAYLLKTGRLNKKGCEIVFPLIRKNSNINTRFSCFGCCNELLRLEPKNAPEEPKNAPEEPSSQCFTNDNYLDIEFEIHGIIVNTNGIFDYAFNRRKYGKKAADFINDNLSFLHCPISEFSSHLEKTIASLENIDIVNERINGSTLEEIGQIKGITRERVRQIEVRILKTLKIIFEIYLNSLLKHDLVEIDYLFIDAEATFQDLSLELTKYLIYVIKGVGLGTLKWNTKLSSIINTNFESEIVDFYDSLEPEDDIFYLSEKIEQINDDHQEFNIFCCPSEVLEEYYRKKGYVLIEDKLYSNEIRNSKRKMFVDVVKKYYPKGIWISDEEFEHFKSIVSREYDYSFDENDVFRNWYNTDVDELILWGPSSRIHINNIYVENELNDKILNLLDEYMKNKDYAVMDDIYNENRDLFETTIFSDKFKLYGYYKYQKKGTYYFKKLTVRKNEFTSDHKVNDEIFDYVKTNGVVSKEILYKKYSVSTITNVLSCPELIQSGHNVYHASRVSLERSELDKISEFINDTITYYGFVNGYNIYCAFANIANKYHVLDWVEFYDLLKYYLSGKFIFYRPYVQQITQTTPLSVKIILNRYFNERIIVDVKELEGYMFERGLWISDSNSITNTFEKNVIKTVCVAKGKIILDSKLVVEDRIINYVKDCLEQLLDNKKGIILNDSIAFANEQVPIECFKIPMNNYLFFSIAKKYFSDKYDFFDDIQNRTLSDFSMCVSKKGECKNYFEVIYYDICRHFTNQTVNENSIRIYLVEEQKVTKKFIPTRVLDLLKSNIVYNNERKLYKFGG